MRPVFIVLIVKCVGTEECGCPPNPDGNKECEEGACARGCDLAFEADIRDNFFNGEDAVIDPNIGRSPEDLRSSIASIQSHVDGSSTLSDVQLRSALETFIANSEILEMDFDSLNSAFVLVDAYENKYGGMFINSRSDNGGFQKEDSDDGYTLERVMIVVQQAIFDEVYRGTLPEKAHQARLHDDIIENCQSYLRGRYWITSTYFPGFVELPSEQPTTVYALNIKATVNKYWGKTECYTDSPAIHATGLYLPPGGVAWVIVPSVLVNKGFQIQVGAHDVDMGKKDTKTRMDRVSSTYEIKNTKTFIASPLGGGVYIKVPYLANYGTQSIQIAGDVIQAPFFCKFIQCLPLSFFHFP